MTSQAPPHAEPSERNRSEKEESFQLSPLMIVIGLIMVAIGIACGLVMSSATFIR